MSEDAKVFPGYRRCARADGVRLGGASRGGTIRQRVRQRWPRLVVMGLVCGGSFVLLMEALAQGRVAYVLTLRNTSVLFALAMGGGRRAAAAGRGWRVGPAL